MIRRSSPFRIALALAAALGTLGGLGFVLARWFASSPLEVGDALFSWPDASITRITLRRGGECLQLQRAPAGAGWQAEGCAAQVDESLQALLEFLHALRVEFPYIPAPQDTVETYLADQGLTVALRSAEGDSIAYTLGMWAEGRIVARGQGFLYIAHALGYFSGIVRTLDLDPLSWSARLLWRGEPSALQLLRLEWAENPSQGFRIERDADSTLRLFTIGGASPLPFDSLRLATLLYAFADLPYAPLPDTLARDYPRRRASYPPYARIALRGRAEAGEYVLYRIPLPSGEGVDPNRAVLVHADGACYLVELFRWDAALVRLDDLQ